ncbi:Dienelactone hydrolase family protein [Porphyromonadaceae bacterium KH3CP3RA]|nr:Dienelactone hydrolase family protein [Porphyromonadaceae bacterium KH3CP3RA]
MTLHRFTFYLFCIFFIICGCTNTSIKITGKVQNGLDGTAISGAKVTLDEIGITAFTDKEGTFTLTIPSDSYLKIVVKDINSNQYLKKESGSSDIVLIVEKEQFKLLSYIISDKINDLIIGILPEPEEFNAEYYSENHMPFTHLMENEVEWERIIDGVRLFHEKRLKDLKPQRERYWNRDISSDEAYNISVESNRRNLRNILGAIDEREPVSLTKTDKVAETEKYTVSQICWPVLKEIIPRPALQNWPELDVPGQIFGEGLLLEPKSRSKGFVIAIPDADQEPEALIGIKEGIDYHSQFARHLAENGYTVVVPVIIDRTSRWSRGTNRTSRSWIYAQTHEMGRTVTGYEIQKMEALIDWFDRQRRQNQTISIAGYGDGGLLAFYTSALDTRVETTLVSGYFAPREEIWKEPIYRNVWGLLKEFGDAEIASLIAPCFLIVEYSQIPVYDGEKNSGTKIDPPGELWTHTFNEVESEFNRHDDA